MRTKDTRTPKTGRKARESLFGRSLTTPATPPATMQSPPQPQPSELPAARVKEVKAYLDRHTDQPFKVTTMATTSGKKRKRTAAYPETNLCEERLDVLYEVQPADIWDSMRRYKKFSVRLSETENETIKVGDFIMVKHDDGDDGGSFDGTRQWKAKVLDVRALDGEHVFVRVGWMYRPEDLAGGRKDYHGKYELIPSNEMDIIDALTVHGKLDVHQWQQDDDESEMPGKEEYFWRQSYDAVNTKTFSKLRHICVDDEPQNPDELILQCPNSECRKWLHAKCIAEDAVQRASGEEPAKKPAKKKSRASTKSQANGHFVSDFDLDPKAQAVSFNSSVLAEVFVDGLPDGSDAGLTASSTELVVTDASGRKSEPVCCLCCKTAIE